MNNFDNIDYVFFILTGYLLQHDDIISLDFHKSGAKVQCFDGLCKETGGAGQNLICNPLSISWLVPSLLTVAQPALRENKASATYTYTAYTDPEYQGVTSRVPYTGGYTDTYTGKSFNNFSCAVTFSSIL